jgi:preprotein translocase subunit SecG
MLTLLLILIIIASALLILIILAQNPKGGGLSNLGSGASQFLGARQTADFLEKATWYFGIGILAVVVFSYFLTVNPTEGGGPKAKVEGADYNFSQPAPAGGNQAPGAQQQPTPGNTAPTQQLPTGEQK